MQDDSFETLQTALDKTDKLPANHFGNEVAIPIDLPANPETATGKDLDPLLTPPDGMTVVQALKEKIDNFAKQVANYNGSKKQLQQVMVALAMHPFMDKSPTFGYNEAQQVYDLGVQILTDKLLFLHIGIKEQEEAKRIREMSPESNENKEVKDGSKES